MFKCYDYDTGRLVLNYDDNIKFDLDIRIPITQVGGESGTGKTLLVETLRVGKSDNFDNWDADDLIDISNICIIDSSDELDNIFKCSKSLIIIDRFDYIIKGRTDIINYITYDRNNHYLILARGNYPLQLTPNYYGKFVNIDGVFHINYRYNVKGWF